MRTPKPVVPDRFICNTCGQQFFTASELGRHIRKHREECGGDCK